MPHHTVAKLHKGREKRIRAGHLWVYASEIASLNGRTQPGGAVEVIAHNGHFLGRGYYNAASQIAIRLMTRQAEEIGLDLLRRRMTDALQHRLRFFAPDDSFRFIHADGDLLPGLIVDKLGDIAVVQILTLGMEVRRHDAYRVIQEVLAPRGIYERSDVSVRALEGMQERIGFVGPEFPTSFAIAENGVPFMVDVAGGQKTGHFLDQKENRRALAGLVTPGADVLDAFCHTGTFGLHALHYGAARVTFLDISEHALETVRENVALSEAGERADYVLGNAFDELRRLERDKHLYDVVVLDPPAFTKSKTAVEAAARGYKEVNIRGIRLTKPGGFVVTCSCSHHMPRDMFRDLVCQAAEDCGRRLRILEYRSQAKDHPVLAGMPETEYLKCLIVQVLD